MSREENRNLSGQGISVAELCYYIYFAMMLFAKGIGLYEGQTVYNLIFLTGTLLIGIKLLLTEHTLYEYLWMGLLVIMSLLVYRNSGEKGLFIYTLMLIGVKGVSIKRLFTIGAVIWSSCFLGMHFLTMIGKMQDVYVVHNKLGLGYLLRWSFGYPHPNVLHISYVIMLVFLLYHAGDDKQKLRVYTILGMLGNLYVFLFSLSYTGVVLATVYLTLNYYLSTRKQISRIEKWMLELIFPGCVLFSIAGPLLIRGRLFELIDKAVNTRFYLSKYFLENQPITLFGTRMNVPNYRYTLDCSYTYAFMWFGVIPFLVICIGYMWLICRCLKENRRKELAVVLGLAIAGIVEPFMFNTSYKNPAFLFLGAALFQASARVTAGLPGILKYKLQCIKAGSREIGNSHKESGKKQKLSFSAKEKCGLLVIFAVAAVVSGSIYAAKVQMPVSIYVPDAATDDIDQEPAYMTKEEIETVKENGALVLAYYGEQERMYHYEGNTITMEYIRGIVETGVWTGSIAAGGAVLILHRKKRHAIINH